MRAPMRRRWRLEKEELSAPAWGYSARDQNMIRKPGSMLTLEYSLLDLDFSEFNHTQTTPNADHRVSKPVRVDLFVNGTPMRECVCP